MNVSLKPGRRHDIQGMRALAVIVVVLFHAGVPFIDGGFIGVDLFFVLSGFLIIGLLTHEISTTGKVRLGEFWARRARRLIPASALVIVVTMAVSSIVLPLSERKSAATDALWSSLFMANWHFAQGDAYADADKGVSPLQHFWSLGVEEQFYILTPVVLALAGLAAVRFGRKPKGARAAAGSRERAGIAVVLTVVVVASLCYSVWLSHSSPVQGYFDSGARAWQLASGGLLALFMSGRHVSVRWANGLSVSGIAILLASLFLLTQGEPVLGLNYPSVLALAPTVGALLLLAGYRENTLVTKALSWRPLGHVGDVSYSFYLWHWPFLILGAAIIENNGLVTNLLLVAGSYVAAEATYRLVENPIRFAPSLRRFYSPGVSIAMGASLVLVTLTVSYGMSDEEPQATRIASVEEVGEMVLPDPDSDGTIPAIFDDTVLDLRPELDVALQDRPEVPGCQVGVESDAVPLDKCIFGNPDADRTVMLVGDSTSTAMFPAVERAAGDDWRIILLAKSACTVADVNRFKGATTGDWPQCRSWRAAIEKTIAEMKPDVLVLGAAQHSLTDVLGNDGKPMKATDAIEHGRAGLTQTLTRLRELVPHVVLLQAPVRAEFSIPDCLLEEASVSACTFDDDTPLVSDLVADDMPNIAYVKTKRDYCSDTCYPVTDRRVVFRDRMHFTQTFAVRFAPQIKVLLDRAM